MKYFDVLPQMVETELLKRGVMTDELLYCVKADLDGEGKYIDIYITFTRETVSVIKGYEKYGKITRKSKKKKILLISQCLNMMSMRLAALRRCMWTGMLIGKSYDRR